MIWRDLPHVTLDTVDKPPSDPDLPSPSETVTNSPPLSPVPNHNMSPNASLDLLTFDDVPNETPDLSVVPELPNIRAPPNSPADPSTPTLDKLPPRREGLRPRHLLKTTLP